MMILTVITSVLTVPESNGSLSTANCSHMITDCEVMDVTNKKYQLYDFYECYGAVADCDTLEEIKQEAEQWESETDGECDLIVRQWDEKLLGYRAVSGSVTMEERR